MTHHQRFRQPSARICLSSRRDLLLLLPFLNITKGYRPILLGFAALNHCHPERRNSRSYVSSTVEGPAFPLEAVRLSKATRRFLDLVAALLLFLLAMPAFIPLPAQTTKSKKPAARQTSPARKSSTKPATSTAKPKAPAGKPHSKTGKTVAPPAKGRPPHPKLPGHPKGQNRTSVLLQAHLTPLFQGSAIRLPDRPRRPRRRHAACAAPLHRSVAAASNS